MLSALPPETVIPDYSAVVAPPSAPPKKRRRAFPGVLVGLVAVALIAVVTMAVIFALSDDTPDRSATPEVSNEPSVVESQSPDSQPSPSVPPSTGASSGVAPADLTPGLVAAGTVVAGDLIEVTEQVYWPDGGPLEIRLQLPALDSIGGLPAGLTPTITDLQVSVNGNPVTPLPGIVEGSWLVRPVDVGLPQWMELRYLVDGVLLRSTPSQPGRALAVVAPLSEPTLDDLPREIRLAGTSVLNVACAGAPNATASLCAHHDSETWVAVPPEGSPAVVVAQLDLPSPA